MGIFGYLLSQIFLIGWSLDGTLKPTPPTPAKDETEETDRDDY